MLTSCLFNILTILAGSSGASGGKDETDSNSNLNSGTLFI